MPTALLSVYHKDGIVEFAQGLHDLGWTLMSTGGTAAELKAAGLPVLEVSSIVGEALFDDLVKTLSREIAIGLLPQDTEENRSKVESLNIPWIELACVDLYPLEQAVAEKLSREEVIKKTDIGGPTMLREGSKGRRIVVCDPLDRAVVLEWLCAERPDEDEFITHLAAKAERRVAVYCGVSAAYHSNGRYHFIAGEKVTDCGYGENRWQHGAALFSLGGNDPLGIRNFHFLSGTAPGLNNYLDLNSVLQVITHIEASWEKNFGHVDPLIAVGSKHTNPCGAAVGEDPIAVLQAMVEGDPLALFGGVVITNFAVDQREAEVLTRHASDGKRSLDLVVAPYITEQAIALLDRKDQRCRAVVNPALARMGLNSIDTQPIFRAVRDGYLVQSNYDLVLDLEDPRIQKYGAMDESVKADIILGWAVGSMSHSNTITLTKDGRVVANGVAQQDRVGCVQVALMRAQRAGSSTSGVTAYSDSFFPFDDGPKTLAEAGVSTIFASSGSRNDKDTVKACEEREVTLLLAPDEYFRGFRH